VKDRVPVSTHAQIKVNVHTPALPDLQVGTGKKGVQTSSGAASKEIAVTGTESGSRNVVVARWSPANDDGANEASDSVTESATSVGGKGAGPVNTEGFMEWICRNMEPGSSLDLELGWEVTVPKGMRWKQASN